MTLNLIETNKSAEWHTFTDNLSACAEDNNAHVSIVHIGDSHLQADFFPGELRRCLHRTFNTTQPARGLIFPYAMAKTNNPHNYRVTWKGNWTCRKALDQQCSNLGLSGIEIATTDTNAMVNIKLTDREITDYGGNILRIFYGNETDGLPPVPEISFPSNCSRAHIDTTRFCITWQIPYHTDSVALSFRNTDSLLPFRLQGIALTTGKGVEYHTIGINGARVSSYLKCDRLKNQLSALQPDLVIISLGTNDSYSARFDSISFSRQITRFVNEIRASQPQSAILLTTPGNNKFKDKTTNPNAVNCANTIRQVARELNCCVWDFNAIMGQPENINLWYDSGLISSDFVHLTHNGYKFQAHLLMDAIIANILESNNPYSDN